MMQNDAENAEFEKSDALLIAALAAGKSHDQAAKLAKVSRATVTRRLTDAAFRQAVQDAQGELVERAIGVLSESATAGAEKLRKLLSAKSETVQLGAAKALIDSIVKLRDHSEIEKLKAEIAELKALIK